LLDSVGGYAVKADSGENERITPGPRMGSPLE